jgi:hypothetical protein
MLDAVCAIDSPGGLELDAIVVVFGLDGQAII